MTILWFVPTKEGGEILQPTRRQSTDQRRRRRQRDHADNFDQASQFILQQVNSSKISLSLSSRSLRVILEHSQSVADVEDFGTWKIEKKLTKAHTCSCLMDASTATGSASSCTVRSCSDSSSPADEEDEWGFYVEDEPDRSE